MRETPCAARGAEPLAFCSSRWGVAGRVDLPAKVGGEGRNATVDREEISSRLMKLLELAGYLLDRR
jgi:hypothetical protein